MKSLSVIVLSTALLIPMTGWAADDHPEWFKCTADDECVVTHEGCNTLTGVNKDHVADYEALMAKTKPDFDCKQPPPDEQKAKVACINGECVVQ